MTELNAAIRNIPVPHRMRKLPISDRGFPVPRFVPWINGQPEFRGFDGEHMGLCVRLKRCWLCGEPLGKFMVFVIGPMCAVNRVSSEPPSHDDCAHYAAKACPFLTQPRMRRNEKDMPEHKGTAGVGIKRNPGVVLVWTTRSYRVFRAPGGVGALFEVGSPTEVEFFAEGRKATRAEVLDSMESGLPLLLNEAVKDGPDAVAALEQMYQQALKLVPLEAA